MLRNLFLYGNLAKKFGKKHMLDVASVGEALRAMEANKPGFLKSIKRDGHYEVVKGDTLNDEHLSEKQLTMQYGNDDFHISPVIEGSKNWMGPIMTVIGAALLVTAYFFPPAAPYLVPLGVSLMLGGIGIMLTPTPPMDDYSQRERPEERASFYFGGPTNTMEQGGSMALLYGRMIIGSTVVSAGIKVEAL